jgi:hypothetical protein
MPAIMLVCRHPVCALFLNGKREDRPVGVMDIPKILWRVQIWQGFDIHWRYLNTAAPSRKAKILTRMVILRTF